MDLQRLGCPTLCTPVLIAPRHAALGACLLLSVLAGQAQVPFTPSDWALHAEFPAEPKVDDHRTPTPQGDELAQRRIVEAGTDRLMLIRFVYPLVPQSEEREALYSQSVQTMLRSRPGKMVENRQEGVGEYPGVRLLIDHRRENTHREVRMVLIGASLYVATAEWAGGPKPSPGAARFLASLDLQPSFINPRAVEERERWRDLVVGKFKLRYDAARWFRDPESTDPETIVLLRLDEMAEAEFMTSKERNPAATMEETVLAHARENAESVRLVRKAKKYRGSAMMEELRFTARVGGVTYENHGYFYSGPEGSVQLRAWSPDRTFARVEGDIAEFLDGLTVLRP